MCTCSIFDWGLQGKRHRGARLLKDLKLVGLVRLQFRREAVAEIHVHWLLKTLPLVFVPTCSRCSNHTSFLSVLPELRQKRASLTVAERVKKANLHLNLLFPPLEKSPPVLSCGSAGEE